MNRFTQAQVTAQNLKVSPLKPNQSRPQSIVERKKGIPEPLEKELQAQIAALLRRNDIWFAWSRSDKRTRNVVGTPDFLFVLEGKPFAWEVKVGNNKLSEEQAKAAGKMIFNGWRHRIIRNYKEALEIINFHTTYLIK